MRERSRVAASAPISGAPMRSRNLAIAVGHRLTRLDLGNRTGELDGKRPIGLTRNLAEPCERIATRGGADRQHVERIGQSGDHPRTPPSRRPLEQRVGSYETGSDHPHGDHDSEAPGDRRYGEHGDKPAEPCPRKLRGDNRARVESTAEPAAIDPLRQTQPLGGIGERSGTPGEPGNCTARAGAELFGQAPKQLPARGEDGEHRRRGEYRAHHASIRHSRRIAANPAT